jgi:hypothetical protein
MLFPLGRAVKRRLPGVGESVKAAQPAFVLALQPDLPPTVAAEPAVVIVGLVDRNAVNPCLQAAVAAKSADLAEDLYKDLLHNVTGVGGVVQQPGNQVVDRLLVLGNESFVCGFDAIAKPLHQPRILTRIPAVTRDLERFDLDWSAEMKACIRHGTASMANLPSTYQGSHLPAMR